MSSSLNNVLSSQRNSKKFLNAKVTFNTEFGNKKDDGGNEDGSKTITVMTGDNQYIKVFNLSPSQFIFILIKYK